MVISHRHRYIYFVIPKCASATVRQSLKNHTDIGYPVTQYEQHVTIQQFLSSEYGSLLQESYLPFTFVRNPYDRLYSGYLQDRLAATRYEKWIPVKAPIFQEIGDDFNRYIQNYVRHAKLLSDWRWICFCPMHAFSYLDGECIVQFIGRAESVEKDLRELGDILKTDIEKSENFNINTPPQENLKYLKKYDRATIEIVNQIYEDDFRLFNYEMLNPLDFPIHAAVPQSNN